MHHYETGDRISTPFDYLDGVEGVNVRFSGSNLEPDEYRILLPRFLRRLLSEADGLADTALFLGAVHEMSNITASERHVRIDREWSSRIVGQTGSLGRLMRLCR